MKSSTKALHQTFVVAEVRNGGVGLDRFTSSEPITMDRLTTFYETAEDFDWERDSIAIVEVSDPVDLDAWEGNGGE